MKQTYEQFFNIDINTVGKEVRKIQREITYDDWGKPIIRRRERAIL
jgi:hypothetical protein